jgi:hypothetical protein
MTARRKLCEYIFSHIHLCNLCSKPALTLVYPYMSLGMDAVDENSGTSLECSNERRRHRSSQLIGSYLTTGGEAVEEEFGVHSGENCNKHLVVVN